MLVKCPECGRRNVSSETNRCPGCGYDIQAYFLRKKSQRIKKITSSAEYQALQNRAYQLREDLADLSRQQNAEMNKQPIISSDYTLFGFIIGVVIAILIGSRVGGIIGFILGFFLITIAFPVSESFINDFNEKEKEKHNRSVTEKYAPLIHGKQEELKEIESTMTKMTSVK